MWLRCWSRAWSPGLVGFCGEGRHHSVPRGIRVLDVFTTVTIAWVAIAAVGAMPYLITGHFTNVDDALFEAMSGFTTTGATVTADIEATSKGLLFWRSTTQWMGGMGVIVLVVAVLPTVGSGGMSLLEAEAPGPTGERLTPRVEQNCSTAVGGLPRLHGADDDSVLRGWHESL